MHIVEVADSCYISSVVCLCVFVCLLVTIMSHPKMAEPIELLIGM